MKEELLNKKVKDLSMDELKALINECVQEHLIKELAFDKAEYGKRCENRADTIYLHLAKVCLFENHPLLKQNVNHWKGEVYGQLYYLASRKLTKDNHSQDIKKRVFRKELIENLFEPHWEDYTVIYRYFLDAVDEEEQEIDQKTYRQVANQNKDRIVNFIESVIPVLGVFEEKTQKKLLRQAIDNF